MNFGVEEHATHHIQQRLESLYELTNWDVVTLDLPQYKRGRSKLEINYRRWCVKEKLCLNYLNDIYINCDALDDDLTFPSITTPTIHNVYLPEVYAIFNQMKQEYVSARFTFFEGLQQKNQALHFSDKKITLYDSLDYRQYRLWIEKLKMAYLMAYGVLDKTAYLVNEYWKLERSEDEINFGGIWFAKSTNKTAERQLHNIFKNSNNPALRGLFSLSRDFFYKSTEEYPQHPDAKELNIIRNHIAHKYLKVHDEFFFPHLHEYQQKSMGYSISDADFISHCTTLFKLVRSVLISLTFAVTHEESRKESDTSSFVVPQPINEIDDSYRL